MPLVKIHYTIEGDTSVIATLTANIAKLAFLHRGLPGQPEGFRPLKVERTDGSEITDWESKPPDTIYVVGVIEKDN